MGPAKSTQQRQREDEEDREQERLVVHMNPLDLR
jgi:hypothetical protein